LDAKDVLLPRQKRELRRRGSFAASRHGRHSADGLNMATSLTLVPDPACPGRPASAETGIRLLSSIHGKMADFRFDQSFVAALRNRDPNAENLLYECFSRPIHLKLRLRLRSPELVEDACQETFLRVFAYFRAGKTLDNPGAMPGFVHAICHNVSLELLRKYTQESQVPDNVADPKDSAPNPESRMVTEERRQFVARVLGEMPERDRELLRRVFLDEDDRGGICRELQVEPEYLRVLLYRARARFKAIALAGNGKAKGASES
jgi:RNA polymerase sigma-70 factor (ECF subfamily)